MLGEQCWRRASCAWCGCSVVDMVIVDVDVTCEMDMDMWGGACTRSKCVRFLQTHKQSRSHSQEDRRRGQCDRGEHLRTTRATATWAQPAGTPRECAPARSRTSAGAKVPGSRMITVRFAPLFLCVCLPGDSPPVQSIETDPHLTLIHAHRWQRGPRLAFVCQWRWSPRK